MRADQRFHQYSSTTVSSLFPAEKRPCRNPLELALSASNAITPTPSALGQFCRSRRGSHRGADQVLRPLLGRDPLRRQDRPPLRRITRRLAISFPLLSPCDPIFRGLDHASKQAWELTVRREGVEQIRSGIAQISISAAFFSKDRKQVQKRSV